MSCLHLANYNSKKTKKIAKFRKLKRVIFEVAPLHANDEHLQIWRHFCSGGLSSFTRIHIIQQMCYRQDRSDLHFLKDSNEFQCLVYAIFSRFMCAHKVIWCTIKKKFQSIFALCYGLHNSQLSTKKDVNVLLFPITLKIPEQRVHNRDFK